MNQGGSKNSSINESIALLIESLCHKIRTPLSVVSNDLKYFETTLGKEETSRSLRRVDEIKNTLKECAEFLNASDAPISIIELCQGVGVAEVPANLGNIILPHGDKIRLSCQYLKKLLTEFDLPENSEAIFKIRREDSRFFLEAQLNRSISADILEIEVFKELGIEGSPLAALSYILLHNSGCAIKLSPEGQAKAKLILTF